MSWYKDIFEGGDVTEKGNNLYGSYQGFPVAATKSTRDNSMVIRIIFQYREESMPELGNMLKSCSRELEGTLKTFKSMKNSGHELQLQFSATMTNGTAKNNAKIAVDRVIDVLKKNGCSQGCEACGGNVSAQWYLIGSTSNYLCPVCYEKVADYYDKIDQAHRNIPVNYAKGIVSAFLGALLSAAIYMVGLRFGKIFISALLPIIPFGMFYFYGKRLDKIGSVVTTILCVICFYFATRFGLAWRISALVPSDYSIMEIYRSLGQLVDASAEIAKVYRKCMIEGFGLSSLVSVILGGYFFFDKGKTKIKDL